MKKTTYDDMYAIVIKVLTEDFKKDIDCLKPETELKKDLNLDSLDRVDFLCAVEAEYGDDVFDEDEDQDADTKKQRQQEFYTTKTIDSFTICLLKAVNEYEEKKGE